METLLDIVNARYGLVIDPDSDGGRILGAFTPAPPLPAGATRGKAGVAPLSVGLTSGGRVTIRAAKVGDIVTLAVPPGSWDFGIVRGADSTVAVEIELLAPKLRLPGARRGRVQDDHTLAEAGAGDVNLIPTKLLLIVEAKPGQADSSARIGPSRDADGALEVDIEPPTFLVGPGTVLGFTLRRIVLDLENPLGAQLRAREFDVYVVPPGVAALAMYGTGADLRIEFGTPGGISGDFALVAAGDPESRPRFLRDPRARVRLNRSSVVLVELTGRIELNTEITTLLGSDIADGPRSLTYRLALTLGDGQKPGDDWKTSLELRGEGGAGLLWRSRKGAQGGAVATKARDTMGAYAVFAPLLTPLVPGAGSSGYVDLAIGPGLAGGLAAGGIISADQVTIYGAELSAGRTSGVTAASLFFEIESDINITVPGLLKSKHPIRVRQKAVGLRLDGELRPVFDPGAGFSLDLSDPGTFEIAQPLGSFLQPDKPGIARENPLVLEFTLRPKTDLGVVTIDSATIRVPLEGGPGASLTGLGARVGLPGLSGSGQIKIEPQGFAGAFDLSLGAPLGLRVAASLSLHDHPDFTSVRLGIDVRWPVPIPLANSGLGLFGLLGMFAVNERRNVGPDETSLDWYLRALDHNPTLGDWIGRDEAWALGLGAVIGTLEGGVLINAKGLLMLELPGPRVALFMEAKLLQAKPDVSGTGRGDLLAVIEISEQSLLIGIVARYQMPFLIALEAPAEAFFDFKRPENWHLDIGQVDGIRVSVRFMQFLKAEGYLMLHGDGIPALGLDGFAIAAGIEAALTWGPEPIGLYIRVAARADVALSYKPAMVRGRVALSGELHLFIVSIGVSAEAALLISESQFHIYARVSGRVDFFFFDVEGAVTFELGTLGLSPPDPDPLLRGLSLHARATALLPGSGVAGPIDGSLGEAIEDGSEGTLPVVPIDAIPVLQFEMTPRVDGTSFAGRPIVERLMADGWTRRGRRFYRYTLTSIAFEAVDAAGQPLAEPLVGTIAPNTWWDQRPAGPQGVIGDDDGAQLALLSWVPSATPAAARRSIERDAEIKRRWGTACDPVAPAANVLWTFAGQPAGPAASGWTLRGIAALDRQGHRTAQPVLKLRVREPWRRERAIADTLFAVQPGYLAGTEGSDDRFLVAPTTGEKLVPRMDEEAFEQWASELGISRELDTMPDAIRIGGDGLRHVRGLVFAPREAGALTLHTRGGDGVYETIDKLVNNLSELPPCWQKDPWYGPVEAAWRAWESSPVGWESGGQLYQFDVCLSDGTTAIDIGLMGGDLSAPVRWGLLAFEALTDAEYRRQDFDNTHRNDMLTVIDGALGVDASQRALLRPGANYAVHIDYSVLSTDADAAGNPIADPALVPTPHRQSFRFRTDTAPPSAIEPLVVATNPEEGAEAIFYKDRIRIVFVSSTVRRIYKQHGVSLFAKVRAASGRHPPSPTGPHPGEVSLDNGGYQPIDIAAQVYTPFESALRDAMTGTCVPVDRRDGERHEVLTLKMDLEASTGYALDLEGRTGTGAVILGTERNPALRRTFTTSRYGTAAEFAAAIRVERPAHRHIADPTALAALAAGANPEGLVTDLALDAALRKLDWGEFGRLIRPRVTVLWHGAATPLPYALYIETPEAAWRSRGTPEQVADAAGAREWKLVPKPWLALEATTPVVTRFVRTASGMRTLALLGSAARGQTVVLNLRRRYHPLFEANEAAPPPAEAVRVTLNAAPWENG